MILRSLSILLFISSYTKAQFFRAPNFDCSRIHPRYCCSTRVRLSCPQLCNQRPCQRAPTFVQPFSPHIPPTLPFPGLAPQTPQQPEQPSPHLPSLIDSSVPIQISTTKSQTQPEPQPPAGIVLPPEGVPLAVGTSFLESGPSLKPFIDNEHGNAKPVDGFAPARGGQFVPTTAIGAGGSFAPQPVTNHFVGIAPTNNGPQPPTNQFTQQPHFISSTTTLQPPQNTFPTLINIVHSSTPLPPAIAPPWSKVDFFSQSPQIASTTSTSTLKQKSQGPASVVDASSRGNARRKAAIPPPNKFSASDGDELIELESLDRRAIQVDSRAAVSKVERAKDTSGFDGIESEIAKTIVIGANTFPPPTFTNFSIQEPETSADKESPARTTVPDKGFGGWSFRIMPSKQSKEASNSGDSNAFTDLNAAEKTATWIANQTQGTTVGLPSRGDGIISGDNLNTIIDSIFTKRTIDTITSLTGKRPPKRPRQQVSSMTAPPPIASNLETTTLLVRNQIGSVPVGNVTNQKCGVAPNFIPCLDLNRANLRLLACCRAKLMPDGCLPLCRYDTTQVEVKKTFDAGKCGILNVAPFLECASQAQDNRQCCQQRGISKKSGPQCEVFCHPRDGLGSLGLQHLTCQHVISDLLQCHHSGLLP